MHWFIQVYTRFTGNNEHRGGKLCNWRSRKRGCKTYDGLVLQNLRYFEPLLNCVSTVFEPGPIVGKLIFCSRKAFKASKRKLQANSVTFLFRQNLFSRKCQVGLAWKITKLSLHKSMTNRSQSYDFQKHAANYCLSQLYSSVKNALQSSPLIFLI